MLTISGSAVALFVFCFVGAIEQGMDDLQQTQAARQSLVVFQANKFCPATSHLPQDYDTAINQIEGVRDVVPIQVFTNNCRASLDVIVFYGLPPTKLRAVRDFRLVDGSWTEFENHQDAAVVGRAVATRRGIHVGEKFSIGSINVQIAGVYQSNDPAEENYIYSHLEFLQRIRGQQQVGTVTQHEVLLEPVVDAEAICDQIDDRFRGGPVETDTRPKGVFQARSLADLAQLIAMAHYLGIASVGLVLVLVATTTIMSVEDRIQEHAVLQTLGFTSARVFGLVVSESVILSLAGGLVGISAAMGMLAASHLSVAAEAVAVAFEPSWQLAGSGLVVAAAVGFLAGIAPGWHAARTEIVSALRA
jgi:putative ABC transport system permease protein